MPSSAPPTRTDALHARYEALLDVAEAIASHRQLSTLLADLSRRLRPLVCFDFMALTLLDAGRQTIGLHVLQTDRPVVSAPVSLPVGETPTGLVLRTRQPLYVPHVAADPRFPVVHQILQANGIQSYCILPLVTAQRDLGGLHFGSIADHAYTPQDVEFMMQVARPVAVAADNALHSEAARAYEADLAGERDRLRALLEINNAVATCLNGKQLFHAISSALRRAFGIDYASLLIYDHESGALRLEMLDFPSGTGAIHQDAVVPLDRSIAGEVFRTRQGRVLSRDEAAATSPATGDIMAREGLLSLCSMPLVSHRDVLGTLNLGSRRADFFRESDRPFFAQAAGQVAIALENALAYRRIEELNARLAEEKIYLEDEIRTESRFEEIIGQSRGLKVILKQVETVAPTDSTVLIYGETGTGKELIARAIHELSQRRQGTFVKLNCAAIPTGLLESEMFGHEKGAFTGAIVQRIGRFELAHRGTMFLDEIGEIPLELQTKLLRVLQEREFERLGSSRTIHTDARLVAATNRDLGAMVEGHHFRADLYYRLNVFPLHIPALRERREDIPLLVNYFVQQCARRMNKRITAIPAEAMQAMARYHWPGNIRELQNFVERAVILTAGSTLEAPLRELKRVPGGSAAATPVQTLAAAEREAILRALSESGGKVGGEQGAAAKLGMKRTTLQARMRKLGIQPKGA